MAEGNALSSLSDAFAALVANASSSVVQVRAEHAQERSGILYDSEHVITAAVFARAGEPVTVTYSAAAGGTRSDRKPNFADVPATVVAHDRGTGLAVLKLQKKLELPSLKRASAAPRVGELAVAVALPSSEGVEAKLGMVRCIGSAYRSANGRNVSGYLQTDALLFPGFAGGPVVNASGDLIGISAIGYRPDSGIILPAADAFAIAADLIERGPVQQGYLGIRTQPAEVPQSARDSLKREQEVGLLVVSVEAGSPAEKAGIVTGDIVVGIGGEAIQSHDELIDRLASGVVGKKTEVEIVRGGSRTTRNVTPTAAESGETGHSGGHHHGGRGGWRRHRWFGMGTAG